MSFFYYFKILYKSFSNAAKYYLFFLQNRSTIDFSSYFLNLNNIHSFTTKTLDKNKLYNVGI
jgi:hypothetical protein